MATIAENLQTLQTIKNNIKTSIENKGVSVGDVAFTEYSTKIDEITTGGGGGTLETINITENGVYVPGEGVDGYNEVNVNVTTPTEVFVLPNGMKLSKSTFSVVPSTLDTSNLTDMSYMFNQCSYIKTIPQLNTSKVTNMGYMFYQCYALDTIPLLQTSNVNNMGYMFFGCDSLTSLPLLDTSNVTNMSYMFNNCQLLTAIPQLNTSKVTSMNYMFNKCYALTSIPLLDTSNVTNMSNIFYNCSALTTIPQLNTSKVTNVGYMFYGCTKLQSLPLLDFSSVTTITSFFGSNVNILTELGGFKNLKVNWSDNYGLVKAQFLTYESVMNVINNLYDFRGNGDTSTTRTIKFSNSTKNLLSDEDIAIATNKGWTIS